MGPLPTIRQLQYLDALSEHLSFHQAAEACFVTQSTLSAGIRDLETTLDARLVERTKRKVMITPLGEEVLARGRMILDLAQDITEITRRAARPLSGVLRLGVIPTVGPFLLPRVLPELQKRFPELELKVHEGLSADLVELMGRGRLDVLLLALPYDAPELEFTTLVDDPFLFAEPCPKPKGKSAGKPIRLDDIEDGERRILLLEDGHCLRDHALSACRLSGADRDFSATSLNMLVQMVGNGFGCTLLPKLAVDAGLAETAGLRVSPFKGPAPARQIGLAWRRSTGRRDEYELLAEFLRERMG